MALSLANTGPVALPALALGSVALLIVARLSLSPTPPLLTLILDLNALLAAVWYRCRRLGPCSVPPGGPVIVVANHTSTADPLILCAACRYRTVSFLIAREYADLGIWGWFVRLVDCVPVDREANDLRATRQALRHLREGKVLGIFLEGRIPAPGEELPPKQGAALLALRSGAPVVPAGIAGTVYREGIAPGFLARHRARIRFGPAVDLRDLAGRTDREAVAIATDRIQQAIHGLLAQTPERASGPGAAGNP